MSKQQIVAVCELAAHLMVSGLPPGIMAPHSSASRCAADAMRLQRLGRSARNAYKRQYEVSYDIEGACIRIRAQIDEVLKPYGMLGMVLRSGVGIADLPPNTNLEGAFVI